MLRAPTRRGAAALACVAVGLLLRTAPGASQEAVPVVYVVPIQGTIDLGLSPFVARAIREAHQSGAGAVVLDINTFGGRVDAAVAIRDALLQSPVPTIAFINPRAISAGALISLACQRVFMTDGGTIGAAAPIVGGISGSEPADEKTVSYLRKEFRATAETRGRPPEIAEAMVDADVAVEGLVESGKLLTLTTTEALAHGVADQRAPSLRAALEAADLAGAETRQLDETWAETLVRFLTGSVISSLLLSVGLLGILVEIRTPGFGVPGAIGLLAIGLFFWGHWIVQLAGWEELLLLVLGLGLLLLEAFVIPGFGVAGLLGIAALVAGLGLALVGAGATAGVVVTALGRVALAILMAIAGGLALLRVLPRLPFGQRLILDADMPADLGYTSPPAADHAWLGRSGSALSPLRPAGLAELDGRRVDVVSDGSFIDAGARVEVTRVDGNRIVVRRVEPHEENLR